MSSRGFTGPRRRGGSGHRRWPLVLAYIALAVSCDNPLAPSVLRVGRVDVRPASATLQIGGSQSFTASVFDVSDQPVVSQTPFWSSQDPTVATVDQEGVVTAVGPGTAQIAASTGGRSGVAVVVVLAPAGRVQISVTPDSIIAPGVVNGTATVLDENDAVLAARPVTLVSSDEGVARVAPAQATTDQNGDVAFTVTGVTAGTASVLAISETKNGSFPVRVLSGVTGMTVSAPADSLIGTGTLQVAAELRDAGNAVLTGRPVTWSTSNPAVATVDPASGLVTGVAPGTVTITGSCEGTQAGLTVRVLPAVASVRVTPSPATVHVGAAYAVRFSAVTLDAHGDTLHGRPVAWSSSSPSLATVDATGTVTGLAAGTAQIRATSEGVQTSASTTIDLVRVSSVTLQPPSATIVPPGTQQLAATARDSAGNAITGAALGARPATWQSSNAAVATVSAAGLVTAVAQGTATVTATIDGTQGNAPITVTAIPVASVTVTPSPTTLFVGQTAPLTATALDANQQPLTGRVFTWSSASPSIVTVDNAGNVTGVAPGGPVAVSATAEGKTGAAQVSVFARPAAQLFIAVQPSATAASGVALSQQPQIQLQDALGGPVAQAGVVVTAAVASGGGTVSSGTTATTDATGLAVFSGLAITGPAGPYTLSFAVPSLTPVTSGTIVLGAGGPSQLSLTTPPPASAQSGVPLSQQPAVTLLDAAGNPVAQSGILVTASLVGGGTLGGTVTVATDAAGVATFSNLAISGPVPGPYSLAFSAPGLTGVTSGSITLSAGPASKLVITTQPAPGAVSGTPLSPQPVVQVQDAAGNNVASAGLQVTASLVGSGANLTGTLTISTDPNGTAAFSDLVLTGTSGQYQIQFTSGTLTPATSSAITLGAGTATKLGIITQPPATAVNTQPFSQQPAVQLLDASGNAVSLANVTVQASIATGSGILNGTATATTNSAGQATFTNLGITGLVGGYTLSFSSGALTPVTSNTITLTPGPATQLAITLQPAGAASSGAALSPQPVVQLRDVSGNNVPQANVLVEATITPSSGVTLSGKFATTDNAGTAAFTALTLTGTAGDYTLTFISGSLTPATSGTVTLSAGTGSKLAITQQPSDTAQNGVVFARQPVIQLQDASGNPVLQSGVQVTAAIATGGGTLGGAVSVSTDASGTATFNDLKITGTVGDRTLIFAANNYQSKTSSTITIVAGPATQLTVTQQPSSAAQSGVVLAQQPVIQLSDVSGNAVKQSGVSVTATVNGGATLTGTSIVTTDQNGVATFTNLAITGLAGSYALTFSSPPLSSAVSSAISLVAGPASQLTITQQPSSPAQSGVPLAQQPIVQLRDGAGNAVSQSGVQVTATVSGGATLSGTVQLSTGTSGAVTFTDLAISALAGSYTLTFSAPSLSNAVSNAISLVAGPAAQLTITQQPSSTAQSGVTFSQQPVIQLRDGAGNPVSQPGVQVTATVSGGATLNGMATISTNSSGVASFTDLGITGLVGTYTLTFASGSLAQAISSAITLNVGPATQLSITTQPSATATSGAVLAQQPVIQLLDAGGNAVLQGGTSVSATVSGGATLGGKTSVNTTGAGTAAFTNLAITGSAGSYTLTFASGTLASVVSNPITLSAGAATQLLIATPPSSTVQSGVPFPQQPSIQVADASGNPVSQQNVVVTAAIASGTGTLSGTLQATTDATGLATFTDLTVTGTVGSLTLGFGATGLSGATSGIISLVAGPATQLSITQQPSSTAQSGVPFTTQPIIQLQDGAGNAVKQPGVSVTASIASGDPSATLGGTATVSTDANGVATFADLAITGPAGSYTLTFGSGTLASAVSNSISLGAGTATQLLIATPPSSTVQSGVPFPQQPSIQVADASGNPVSQQNVVVTAALASGTGTLSGTLQATTDATGLATFTDLTVTGTAGALTLSFSATGLTPVSSGTISLVTGPATQLSITQQPSSTAQSGVPLPQQPVIQLQDGAGNDVSQAGVQVTATVSGGATLNGAIMVTTDASGQVTFTDLAISGLVGSYTLTFSAPSLTDAVSNSITLDPGPAAQLTITTEPGGVASGALLAPQPVIQVRDAENNAVAQSGIMVTASIASGDLSATLTGTLMMTTDNNGVATFTDLVITGPSGNYTLQFVSGALNPATSVAIVIP